MLDIASNRIKKIENVSHLTELQEFWVSLTPPLGWIGVRGGGARRTVAWCAAALGVRLVGLDTGLGCGRSAELHLGASQNEEQTGPAAGRGRVGGCASEVGVPLRAL